MSEKKVRQHKFVDKHPFIASLIFLAVSFVFTQLVGSIAGVIISMATGADVQGSIPFFAAAASSLLALLIYKRMFRPEFEGNLRGGNPAFGFKFIIVLIIYWLIIMPLTFNFTSAQMGPPTIYTVASSTSAGFCEEVACRGIAISLLLRCINDEKRILHALIFTSVIFGLIHGFNIFAGADPGSTVIQIISAAGIGVFFGAIFIRSGNLWPAIVFHVAQDVVAFLDVTNIQDGVVIGRVNWTSYLDTAICIVLAVIGFYLIRSAKRAEIRELWKKKWSVLPETESVGTGA